MITACKMADLVNNVMVVSLVATALYAFGSSLIAHLIAKKLPVVEKWVVAWLGFDALIHFTLEGPFVLISMTGTVNESTHFASHLWKEYGKADSRWLVSDPTILALESLTVFFDGPVCLFLIYAIMQGKPYRHFLQVVLCVCEIYGGWMTFCPDWLIGSPHLNTDKPLYLWVYLAFFNGLWVVVPLLLLGQSWFAISAMGAEAKTQAPSPKKLNDKDRQASPPSSQYSLRNRKDHTS